MIGFIIGVVLVISVLIVAWTFLILHLSKNIKKHFKYHIDALEIKINRKGEKFPIIKEDFDKSGIPIIKVKIKGKDYKFMLDSGANVNVIDSRLLEEIKEENTEIQASNGMTVASGDMNAGGVMPLTFKHKNKTFTEDFELLDMSDAFNSIAQRDGVELHGILGSKFFNKHKWSIDFEDLVIWIK